MALNNLSKDLNYLFDEVSANKTNTLLWSGSKWMDGNTTITLSGKVSDQPKGIVLVFSGVSNPLNQTSSVDSYWHTFFVPKAIVNIDNGGATSFVLTREKALIPKKVYINNTSIKGHSSNAITLFSLMGQTVNTRQFVLRYVYGV